MRLAASSLFSKCRIEDDDEGDDVLASAVPVGRRKILGHSLASVENSAPKTRCNCAKLIIILDGKPFLVFYLIDIIYLHTWHGVCLLLLYRRLSEFSEWFSDGCQ